MNCYGFELIWSREIKEIKGTVKLYRYTKNKAEVLSVENNDENKVFGISFRTPPKDNTGVAHILEHSVLCGSRKYPVKEPFVELLKGSLQTFLNALTFPDKTCYPVASQNVQDFYNLIDVYLDSVFYPRITPDIFSQEGWHLELTDPEGPLSYKGVVYNEMKGAYSSPDSLLQEYAQESLFPNTPYGLESGGHPENIPELTYEDFYNFHQIYYHPSNAKIFFYGDDDPQERLRILDEYLKDFEEIEVDSWIPLQPRYNKPQKETHFYTADQEKGAGCQICLNWLLDVTTNIQQNLAFQVLENLLIGMTASPLRKALIDSGLGEDLAGIGLEPDLRQMFFSTGLKGVQEDNLGQVEDLIFSTLDQISRQGFETKTVEAAFNSLEFELRENNTGSMPRGLLIMIRALSTWLYEADPTLLMAFERPLSDLREKVQAGDPVFERLIKDYFLENWHRSTVILKPDPEKGRSLEKKEKERLSDLEEILNDPQKQEILEKTQRLKRKQEEPDNPEVLKKIPRLGIDDLSREVQVIPLSEEEVNGTKILSHELSTNGIVYLDLAFDLTNLPQKYISYIFLFGRCLTEMGTDKEDYVQLSQRIKAKTGGIHPEIYTSWEEEKQDLTAKLFLRGKSMSDKFQELTNIYGDILNSLELNNKTRFKQIVLEEKAGLEHRLIPAGHVMVNRRLRSKFNKADWLQEHISGVSYLVFLRYLSQEIENNWPRVLSILENIKEYLINKRLMLFNLTFEEENHQDVMSNISSLLKRLPEKEAEKTIWLWDCLSGYEGMYLPSHVNYVGKAINLYSLGYPFQATSLVVNRYLRTSWLWDKIRVQGGAYGAFSNFDYHSGLITFISYRDPNILNTLEVYDQTADFLKNAPLNETEIEKAIIGAIGDMDRYLLPDAKGMTSMIRYLIDETDEKRQRMREKILSTTKEDFREFGQWLEHIKDNGQVVILGDPANLKKAQDQGLKLEHFWQIL